ncbi:ATP-binding protein [Spongiivirga sp. MCCC 1A20706]|uniref:tetratricopeptide repeat-containing sensor histidine kinase n=1 Tax=Spongiivirga sp. MCCC 1A20706 TaxID=3160963 RepID=UPI003977B806
MRIIGLLLLMTLSSISVRAQNLNSKEKLQKFRAIHDTILKGKSVEDVSNWMTLIDSLEQNYIVPEKNDSLVALINYLKGSYHYENKGFDKAMLYWNIAGELLEKAKDSTALIKLYNEMSIVFMSTRDVKKAITYKKQALSFCSEKKYPSWHAALLGNIAFVYGNLGEKDSLLKYANRSYNIASKYKDSTGIGKYYMIMSEYSNKLKNYDQVLAYSDTINRRYTKFLATDVLEKVYYRESVALLEKKKPKLALEKAELCLDILSKEGVVFNLPSIYEHISKIYEALGRNKKALYYLKKSKNYKDSLFVKEQQQTILDLEAKYETEKKENENLKLKEEASRKDLTIARKNNYILIGSLVFLVVLGAMVLYQLRKFKNNNLALKRSMLLKETAERELELVRDNIAKDFHDDMGNKLARITALSDLMISSAASKEKNEIITALKNIRKDSDILYRGTRDFMFSLKSKNDYIEELFTYLSDFGEEFFQPLDIDFFVHKAIDRNMKLPHYWNRQIILIFKEAMTNTAKYSKATKSKLSINFKGSQLHIAFEDNGIGFKEDQLKRQNGLLNMRMRAKRIKGCLSIDSNANGTSVNFEAILPK